MSRPGPARRREAELHAAAAAEARRHRWRVAVVDGVWRIAYRDVDIGRWVTLPDRLGHDPDADLAAERGRMVAWLHAVVGVTRGVLTVDYEAAAAGRIAFVWEPGAR